VRTIKIYIARRCSSRCLLLRYSPSEMSSFPSIFIFCSLFSHLKTIAYGPLCRSVYTQHLCIAFYRLYGCVFFECLTVCQKCSTATFLLLCVWLFIGGNQKQCQTKESPTTSPKKMPPTPALFPPNQSAAPRVGLLTSQSVVHTYIYSSFFILFCSNILFFEWLSGNCRYFHEWEEFFHCDDGWEYIERKIGENKAILWQDDQILRGWIYHLKSW